MVGWVIVLAMLCTDCCGGRDDRVKRGLEGGVGVDAKLLSGEADIVLKLVSENIVRNNVLVKMW
jgi:hypothetical protein